MTNFPVMISPHLAHRDLTNQLNINTREEARNHTRRAYDYQFRNIRRLQRVPDIDGIQSNLDGIQSLLPAS